ncbi:rubredoxin [Fundidesulfovibrio terrae]|uniref:rubredoxin n=1 Tax=Fundidesulfovibrio terrae TaxID=2922866 RepID=UPI001FAEFC8A|nr:rubredoxin [Fundidesulfovibrio terrae]
MDDRYVCLLCGYTYDPKRGDAKGGIEPGTPGDKLPPDWRCPSCATSQDNFAKRDD